MCGVFDWFGVVDMEKDMERERAIVVLRLALLNALEVLPDCDNPHAEEVIRQARRAIRDTEPVGAEGE